jgi:hypothetical protein
MILAPVLKQTHLDANGNPLVGGKLYSYTAGTLTPLATYADADGDVENANPVILDANGQADVWMDVDTAYKFALTDADDVPVWTVDGVTTAGSVGTASLQDGVVTTAKLGDDSVTADKLADSVATDGDRAVTTNHIRNSAVTAAKVADGAVSTAKLGDGIVTQAKMATRATGTSVAAGGVAISATSGAAFTTGASFVDVTNLSVTIVTTGRPVYVGLISGATGDSDGRVYVNGSAPASGVCAILRDGVQITSHGVSTSGTNNGSPCGSISHIDAGLAAGTYVYKLQFKSISGAEITVDDAKLVAYEI